MLQESLLLAKLLLFTVDKVNVDGRFDVASGFIVADGVTVAGGVTVASGIAVVGNED